MWRRIALGVALAAGGAAVTLWPVHRAAADETANTDIKIQATLDAVDCTANTISVLGLTIDISTAVIETDGDSGGDSGSDGEDGGGTPTPTVTPPSCSALVQGDSVEVHLASDATPLSATSVDDQGSGGDGEVSLEGPLQAIDAAGDATDGTHIQVLGLTIDISQLNSGDMEGDDDSGTPTGSAGPSTLMVGQFVEVQLDPGQLPALVATSLDVKSFTNSVEVEVDDQGGNEVDDQDTNDVSVDVDETVTVQAPPTPGATTTSRVRHIRKHLSFTVAAGHGGVVTLPGLPKGHAKITVTRASNNTTGHRSVMVKPDQVRSVRVRLRPAK